jgi:two-component system, cell cycle sensor histidine kinase and response regulator CckA
MTRPKPERASPEPLEPIDPFGGPGPHDQDRMDMAATRPTPPHDGRVPAWDLRVAVGLFLGWLLLARAGPMLELAPGVRAWYPPAALLAAACILWGARALIPIIAASSLLLVLTPPPTEALWRVLVISALLKVVYWASSRMLLARRFDCSFSSPHDVARFGFTYLATAGIAALLNALDMRGVAGTLLPSGLQLVRGFWIGDLVAIVALAPALIVTVQWITSGRDSSVGVALSRLRASWPPSTALQLASVPLALFVATSLAPSVGFFSFALCFLPLGWIALSRGARAAALTNVILSIGTVSLLHGSLGTTAKGLEIQAFVGMLVVTGLLVGSVADQRERAFALLGRSEERYRRLVELLPDPLVVHADGRVLFANTAAAQVLGCTNGAGLVGVSLASLATPRSRQAVEDRMRELSEGRAVKMTHHTMHRVDGKGTVDLESVSIPFEYQGAAAALTVARDVSARVQLEEQLRHAQRMEAVGRLAGGVAHDFNNLLTVIISYSELILSDAGDDPVLAADVGEIRNAADRAAALTRQLLSFSRRQVLQPASLDINSVVRGAEGLLRRLIGPEIEIVARLDPAAGTVYADRGQLEQVIMNLVVNARDAMPDGGVLTVETALVSAADVPEPARAVSRADRFATIVVRDTGKGMDAETMRRIFDPFFTTKEVGRGTGLGLATVHGIMEQSGGAVSVQSTPGYGSEFRILLPALGHALHQPEVAGEPAACAAARGSGRVLLVEDDPAVREGVRRMLGASGYEVVEAANGSAALATLARDGHSFEVLLSDVAMPSLDGRQLSREVRARWPALPIVLMSGFADPDAVERDVPGVTFLQKPLEVATLVAAVQGAARRS